MKDNKKVKENNVVNLEEISLNIDRLEDENLQLTNQLKRALADYQNLEKNTQKRVSLMYFQSKKSLVEKIIPVIGSSKNWGTKAGNKLTKSSSVSYRGVNNTTLKEYGEVFSFEPWEGKEGLFVLVGDAETDTDDSDIDVTPINNESDKDLNNEEDEDLSFDDLNDIDTDDNELKDFDFSI